MCNFFQIPYGEGEFSSHSFNYLEFCKHYHLNTLTTYNGLTALERLGVIQLSKQFGRKSVLKFKISSEKLIKYLDQHPSIAIIGKTILRMYGGIFETPTSVRIELIASKTGQLGKHHHKSTRKDGKRRSLGVKNYFIPMRPLPLLSREKIKKINQSRFQTVARLES